MAEHAAAIADRLVTANIGPMSLRWREPGMSIVGEAFYRLCRGVVRALFEVMYGVRVRGGEHVPRRGGGLIVCNHESHLDPPLVGVAAPRRALVFIARSGLFRFKPFAWLIGSLGALPIRERESDVAAMKRALTLIDGGRLVLIFPEGTRSPDGELKDFKRGAWLLVSRAKCPVVPAAVSGAYENWPRDRKRPRLWGTPCTVTFGPVIEYSALEELKPDEGLAFLRERVAALRV